MLMSRCMQDLVTSQGGVVTGAAEGWGTLLFRLIVMKVLSYAAVQFFPKSEEFVLCMVAVLGHFRRLSSTSVSSS